jgi:hypothetical protein
MSNSVAIVGAGVSGLACAQILHDQGCRVTLFDKGRRAGGRASTREQLIGGARYRFDFGAQYFTPRHPDFAAQAQAWAQRGLAAPWPAAGDDAWVGVPDMAAVVADLARGLEVHWSSHVQSIARRAGSWTLTLTEGSAGPFDALVLAMPAEQVAALAGAQDFMLARRAVQSPSRPCWAVMLAFSAPLRVEADVLRDIGPIAWAARDSAKPGRDGGEAWVLHASSAWSVANLDLTAEAVAEQLTIAFMTHLGLVSQPVGARAHRWRYALSSPGSDGAYWNAQLALGACGDWLLAPRLECAWLSGRMLAGRIAEDVAQQGVRAASQG